MDTKNKEVNGILYRINSILCISLITEISEVIQDQTIQAIPLSQPWLLGLIPLRGKAIPITDLEGFISHSQFPSSTRLTPTAALSNKTKSAAIIVFSQSNWTYGIRISQLLGLNTFTIKNETPLTPHSLESVKELIEGTTTIMNEPAYILNLPKLTLNTHFMSPYQL